MQEFASIHGDKLKALRQNPKLPVTDHPIVEQAIDKYERWRSDLEGVTGEQNAKMIQLVQLLDAYKRDLDLALVFDSNHNFLYRQRGQLKLDNTILEEFLPIFMVKLLGDALAQYNLDIGSKTCFSSIYFASTIVSTESAGGLKLREKDHDFVISRPLYLRASHHANFADDVLHQTHIAYIAMECKTNLDKTMFQEAAATALDLKTSVPNAKYYLLCEWLDMTPISSSTTAIDEVLVLRKARRITSNIRSGFSTVEGRKAYRDAYQTYLQAHPFSVDVFHRLIAHLQRLIGISSEEDVLRRGHF